MKNYLNAYCLFFFVISRTLISCVPQTCNEKTESFAGATFYKMGTGKIEAPDTVSIYCLKNGNPLFYEKLVKRSIIYLPFDASAEKCSFLLKINQSTDTISFDYTTFPGLISRECGYTFYFSVTGYITTKNIIDTIIVVNSRITNRDEENLRIFY